MLETLTAIQFNRAFNNGRTQPLLLTCEDSLGEQYDIVVKARGHSELKSGGLLFEGFASLLAAQLELPVPKSFIVDVTEDFANSVIDLEHKQTLLNSIGPNFGTLYWKSGYTIWAKSKCVPPSLETLAAEVFAFDGIIQNPDRGSMKPNCVFKGSQIIIFDHELAFSHFLDIFPKNPWEQDSLGFLSKHLFRSSLKDKPFEFTSFESKFRAVDRQTLEAYADLIPQEWHSPSIDKERIPNYLLSCIENFDDIKVQLETELR